jgi:hypothetical protein
MGFLRILFLFFALALLGIGYLFVRLEWETRCDLNPEISCGELTFIPISDSIPLSSLTMQLQDLTGEWDIRKTSEMKQRLNPVLKTSEEQLRHRLSELSPLGASIYLFRYYRQLEGELEYRARNEAEDYYRLQLLQMLYRASESLKEKGEVNPQEAD